MSLVNKGKKITMDEGDFGLSLTFTITSDIMLDTDEVIMQIMKESDDTIIIEKDYKHLTPEENGDYIISFELTEKEALRLRKGAYKYNLKAFSEGVLRNTFIKNESFIVR